MANTIASSDDQLARNGATSFSTATSETIIDLDTLLHSRSSLRQNEPILSLDSLIAHPEAAVFAHHTTLSSPSGPSFTPTPLLRTLQCNPSRLTLFSSPPSYTSHSSTNFAVEYTSFHPPQRSHNLESQIQLQPLGGDSDAPPPYLTHLTTDPPAPGYTSADKRRGRRIRICEILRGRRRSERCWWIFVSLLIFLVVGALVFGAEESVRTRPELGLGH
ncbi:hypothetical protein BDW66DRAFT_153825 [Aspergillus desertorum]